MTPLLIFNLESIDTDGKRGHHGLRINSRVDPFKSIALSRILRSCDGNELQKVETSLMGDSLIQELRKSFLVLAKTEWTDQQVQTIFRQVGRTFHSVQEWKKNTFLKTLDYGPAFLTFTSLIDSLTHVSESPVGEEIATMLRTCPETVDQKGTDLINRFTESVVTYIQLDEAAAAASSSTFHVTATPVPKKPTQLLNESSFLLNCEAIVAGYMERELSPEEKEKIADVLGAAGNESIGTALVNPNAARVWASLLCASQGDCVVPIDDLMDRIQKDINGPLVEAWMG